MEHRVAVETEHQGGAHRETIILYMSAHVEVIALSLEHRLSARHTLELIERIEAHQHLAACARIQQKLAGFIRFLIREHRNWNERTRIEQYATSVEGAEQHGVVSFVTGISGSETSHGIEDSCPALVEERRIECFILTIESAHTLCIGTMKIEHQHICLVQRLAIDAEAFRIFGQQLRTDIHSVANQLWIVGIVKKRQVLGHRAAGWNPVAVADHQNIANRNTAAIHTADVEVSTDVASDIRIELTVFQRQTSHIVAGATYGEV